MKSGTRIKAVAFALTVVFLASITVAGFASAASSNAAAGVYLTFAISKERATTVYPTSSWMTLLSITMPNVGYSAWWNVVCDGMVYLEGTELEIGIGVDSTSIDQTTRKYYGYNPSGSNAKFISGTHTESMYYLGPGSHTFYFMATKYEGTGPSCNCYNNRITVTFFTDAYVSSIAGAEVGVDAETG